MQFDETVSLNQRYCFINSDIIDSEFTINIINHETDNKYKALFTIIQNIDITFAM